MSDSPLQVIQPSDWAPPRGYANGILGEGRVLYIGGQIGWNAQQEFVADDFVGQTRQALQNILDVLAEAGGQPQHLARMTWYLRDIEEYRRSLRPLGQIYRELLGDWYPAMSAFQVGALVEKQALLEIEATAILPLP